jgi:protein pelota
MRQLRTQIEPRTGAGSVRLQADDGEDMWHIFNLLRVGDKVTAATVRLFCVFYDKRERSE